MTQEEKKAAMKDLFEIRAGMIEDSIRLYKESDGLFCIGNDTEREIHISSTRWNEVVDAMQPVVTYDPNWDERFPKIMAYFYVELSGNKYKVFTLLNKEG